MVRERRRQFRTNFGRVARRFAESRSGLIIGDFAGNSGHEGRRAREGLVNVGFSAFHEGRGAGKKDPPGGQRLVNRKK
jgi:hypothetical protein